MITKDYAAKYFSIALINSKEYSPIKRFPGVYSFYNINDTYLFLEERASIDRVTFIADDEEKIKETKSELESNLGIELSENLLNEVIMELI